MFSSRSWINEPSVFVCFSTFIQGPKRGRILPVAPHLVTGELRQPAFSDRVFPSMPQISFSKMPQASWRPHIQGGHVQTFVLFPNSEHTTNSMAISFEERKSPITDLMSQFSPHLPHKGMAVPRVPLALLTRWQRGGEWVLFSSSSWKMKWLIPCNKALIIYHFWIITATCKFTGCKTIGLCLLNVRQSLARQCHLPVLMNYL